MNQPSSYVEGSPAHDPHGEEHEKETEEHKVLQHGGLLPRANGCTRRATVEEPRDTLALKPTLWQEPLLFPRYSFAIPSLFFFGLTGLHAAPPSKPVSSLLKSSGGSNTVTNFDAAPPPAGTPCTVTLFSNFQFADFNAQYFTYTPSCPGPWSAIKFVGNFAITPGIQYDRTAEISIGYVNVYYGTTREDDPSFGPVWNVTRDLTDYAPLFDTSQPGEVDLGNLVNSQYTGVISGTATLEFYPVAKGATPPTVADAVYPLPNAPGGAVALNDTASQLTETFTLPTNVERAYLDVLTQSQSNDEFWWSCAPNDIAGELEDCGNTAFREAEISIDGTPAGVAPVYPWIYTGGIDPNLWLPIPDIQTLNFIPYRVDLTPFAGTLSNGQPHSVSLSVYNANSYFLATATLLVYEDHGSTTVTGATTINTLGDGPTPSVMENITIDQNGVPVGTVSVTSKRQFTLSGYVMTSHGMETTTVDESVNFGNLQTYTETSDLFQQLTTVNETTTIATGANAVSTTQNYKYPLNVTLSVFTGTSGDEDETVGVQQSYQRSANTLINGSPSSSNGTVSNYNGSDTIDLVTGEDVGQVSTEINQSTNNGACIEFAIQAVNDSVTSHGFVSCKQ